jgi:hypothetical protein
LYIIYEGDNKLFPLFVGTNTYDNTIIINDYNYIDIYNRVSIDFNLSFYDYFQSEKVTMFTHNYIYSKMKLMIERNPYKERYHNNDCFIHVRLGDVARYNPGSSYYVGILSTLNVDRVYLSTDSKDHPIIQELMQDKRIQLYENTPVDTILFASTNKHIILSHGTFSGIIGYLAFYSTVYYLKENETNAWDYYGGNGKYSIFKGKHTTQGPFLECKWK